MPITDNARQIAAIEFLKQGKLSLVNREGKWIVQNNKGSDVLITSYEDPIEAIETAKNNLEQAQRRELDTNLALLARNLELRTYYLKPDLETIDSYQIIESETNNLIETRIGFVSSLIRIGELVKDKRVRGSIYA